MTIFSVQINPSLKGDKIKLPPTELEILLNSFQVEKGGKLPHPITFELVRGNRWRAIGTVLEFTAESGIVEVGLFMARELQIEDNSTYQLNANLISLPTCTFAVLEPLSANYIEIPDIRSLLESHLRSNYSTIYQGAVLEIDFGRSQVVKFKVKKLEPEPACVCLDTDLAVDIESSAFNVTQQASSSKAPTWFKSDSGFCMTISVKNQETENHVVKIPKVTNQEIIQYQFTLELQNSNTDLNVYISDSNELPSLLDHLFFNVEKGFRSFTFTIDSSSITDNPFLFIGLTPFNCNPSELAYSLQILAGPRGKSDIVEESLSTEPSTSDSQVCPNCTLSIPSRTFQTHLAFCERNNMLCNKCKKVFKKSDFGNHWHCEQCDKSGHVAEKEKHVSIQHTLVQCSCGEELYPAQVSQHKKFDCVDRFIICRYCHLLLRAGPKSTSAKDLILGHGLTVHESTCGARTIACQKCGKSIQLKDISIHAKTHEMQKQNQPLPFQMCSNSICGNPQNAQFLNNLKLCQSCFRPFYSPRYDPTNQKLPQKIVETYHSQLTIGCGQDYCVNPFCCTSTDKSICPNGPLLPNDSAILAVQMLQKSAVLNPNTPQYSLCMSQDSTSATRHLLANQLSEMSKNESKKVFKREWCIKALMECKEDLLNAYRWLLSNAPSA